MHSCHEHLCVQTVTHNLKYLHVARGATERLGEVPNLGLTPVGLGEEGFGIRAVESLVKELLC